MGAPKVAALPEAGRPNHAPNVGVPLGSFLQVIEQLARKIQVRVRAT